MSRLQELEKKKEEEKSIKTGDYHAIDRFSYSRLVVFEKNIWDFYKQFIEKDQEYIAKKTEDKEESWFIKMGDLIDCLRTNNSNYNKLFYESREVPEPAPQMLKFCRILYKHKDLPFKTAFEVAYEDLKEWNGGKLGTTFEKYIEKFEKEGQAYYDELCLSEGKTVITKDDLSKVEQVLNLIEQYSLFKDFGTTINKQIIFFELDELPFKAEIDKINIDHKNKIIYPYDYKTFYNPEEFVSLRFVKNYYYIQASLYKYAIETWAQEKYHGYKVENMTFRVIDPNGAHIPLEYKTTDKHYEQGFLGFYYKGKRYPGITEIVDNIKYAMQNDIWKTLPYFHKNNYKVFIPEFKDITDGE